MLVLPCDSFWKQRSNFSICKHCRSAKIKARKIIDTFYVGTENIEKFDRGMLLSKGQERILV